MKYSVKFFIEKRQKKPLFAPINIDVTFSGSRLRYFTGFRLSTKKWTFNKSWIPDNWDMNSGRVISGCDVYEGKKKTTAMKVNRLFNKIDGSMDELFNSKLPPDAETVKKYLYEILQKHEKQETTEQEPENDRTFWGMYERYLREAKVSPGRRKQLKVTMNHLKAFDPDLTFEALTPEKLYKFEMYMTDENKRGKNTVAGQLKKFRAFLNWARREMRGLSYPFEDYKIDSEVYGEPIFLTLGEMDILYKAELNDERLERLRDIFLFQCYIGCRVGDLVQLTTKNLVSGNIVYIPRKTKDEKPVTLEVPLTERAKEIIRRYQIPGGMLLPFISPQKYNEGLKDVFKHDKVKLDRVVIRLNPQTRTEEAVRLCDIISSHMARRTFIGNQYGKVDTSIIASMTGHVKHSKAFGRYYSVTKELKQTAIKFLE